MLSFIVAIPVLYCIIYYAQRSYLFIISFLVRYSDHHQAIAYKLLKRQTCKQRLYYFCETFQLQSFIFLCILCGSCFVCVYIDIS
jgi:hypothetical protein